MKIAGDLTIEDWKTLQNNLDVNNNDFWTKAFEYFDKRMATRYLNPINYISKMKSNDGEGFAVMNLQCSLIETIESFINGWLFDKNNIWNDRQNIKIEGFKNYHIFNSFFEKRKPFDIIDGNSFYQSVRCGLLHETQTKDGWRILREKSSIFFDPQSKTIYWLTFQQELIKFINTYKDCIINCKDFDEISAETLRRNYIAKFNHICEKS